MTIDTNNLESLRDIAAMPIGSAWLCEHCRAVTNMPQCAYCASQVVHPLGDLLGEGARKEERACVLNGATI